MDAQSYILFEKDQPTTVRSEIMNIFGENAFFLSKTSFQYMAREITLLYVNLNGKLLSAICIKLESFDSRTRQTNA